MNRKDYYSGNRYEMLEFIPENVSKILEVGCGFGHFGKAVKGKFIRFLSLNQIEDIKDFKDFEYDGFKWNGECFIKTVD